MYFCGQFLAAVFDILHFCINNACSVLDRKDICKYVAKNKINYDVQCTLYNKKFNNNVTLTLNKSKSPF